MHCVLIKRGAERGGVGRGTGRGCICFTMDTGGENVNQLRVLSDCAFVSRHNAEPIRVSITVTLIPANQSGSRDTSAVTKACYTPPVVSTVLINGLFL